MNGSGGEAETNLHFASPVAALRANSATAIPRPRPGFDAGPPGPGTRTESGARGRYFFEVRSCQDPIFAGLHSFLNSSRTVRPQAQSRLPPSRRSSDSAFPITHSWTSGWHAHGKETQRHHKHLPQGIAQILESSGVLGERSRVSALTVSREGLQTDSVERGQIRPSLGLEGASSERSEQPNCLRRREVRLEGCSARQDRRW